MNIKKVDDKPMVIHTKEKAKLHVKQKPEAKIKGRNVLVVEKGPKIAGADRDYKADSKKTAIKGKPDAKEEIRNSMQKENGVYARMQKSKQDSKKAVGKKNSTAGTVASVGAMYNVPYKVDTTRERDCLKCWLPLGKIIYSC